MIKQQEIREELERIAQRWSMGRTLSTSDEFLFTTMGQEMVHFLASQGVVLKTGISEYGVHQATEPLIGEG